jgi:hypothetical protein
MTFRKQTTRKAERAAKVKAARIQDNTPKTKAAKKSKPVDLTVPNPRRSARVAARSTVKGASKNEKRFRDGPQFVQILRSEKELPRTLATLKRMSRIEFLESVADGINPFPGLTKTEVTELVRQLKSVPRGERQKIYDKAYETGIDRVLANTFGYRYESARDSASHVWFWDQALGSWRYWIISGTGRVYESFHLTPPPRIALAWEKHLELCGHPSLDLRSQPTFHWTEDDSIKVVAMPLSIITDRETWLSTEYLKSQLIEGAVSKHFRIPVDDIIDPCLIVEHSEAVPRLRIGMPLHDPFTPLGFLEYHDDDEDGDKTLYESESDHAPWGMVCWDWVFSDFGLNVGRYVAPGDYFFQQDGDTYNLTLKKPVGLSEEQETVWHAEIPYGSFASFARAVGATFWPPTPSAALNPLGLPQSSKEVHASSTTPIIYPESPLALASVPIIRYKSGKPWSPERLSNQAADLGVSTPALADIATHLRVALPAQPSPLPVIRSTRSPRLKRKTASTLNSPSQLP